MIPDEPVVARIRVGRSRSRLASVADVLLLDLDHDGSCADLFRRYPGLTLAVRPGAVGLTVAVRDGRLLTIAPGTTDPVAVARLVYRWWSSGVCPTSATARAAAASAGFAVTVGRWRGHRAEPLPHAGRPGGALSVENLQG